MLTVRTATPGRGFSPARAAPTWKTPPAAAGLEASTYRELKQRLSDLGRPVDPEVVERLRVFVDQVTEHAQPSP